MENSNNGSMEELIEFPVKYTFKAMGENSATFVEDVRSVFGHTEIHDLKENKSSKGTYTSVSVTVTVNSFDELKKIYADIKIIKGLKYHL